MTVLPPVTGVTWMSTCRLVPGRYPAVGVFERVAAPEDLPELFELEGWTNDRLSAQLGLLHVIPQEEWIAGPMSSVVMAAFCHPPAGGGRFSDDMRGAWYAARTLETAIAESIHRRAREFAEIGVDDAHVQMRLYHADVDAAFHDVRGGSWSAALDPASHQPGQDLGRRLFDAGAGGVVYPSVRREGGECVVSFRPRLVTNVRAGGHFAYRWRGAREPEVMSLA